MKKITVKQSEEKQIPVEIMAESIQSISEGIKKLRSGPLNDKALFLLIQHAAPMLAYSKKVGMAEIKAVISGIENLETTYLKKKPKT